MNCSVSHLTRPMNISTCSVKKSCIVYNHRFVRRLQCSIPIVIVIYPKLYFEAYPKVKRPKNSIWLKEILFFFLFSFSKILIGQRCLQRDTSQDITRVSYGLELCWCCQRICFRKFTRRFIRSMFVSCKNFFGKHSF